MGIGEGGWMGSEKGAGAGAIGQSGEGNRETGEMR